MNVTQWLAREAQQDEAQGLPEHISDPTALRLLALGLTAAKQAPTMRSKPRNSVGGYPHSPESAQGHTAAR